MDMSGRELYPTASADEQSQRMSVVARARRVRVGAGLVGVMLCACSSAVPTGRTPAVIGVASGGGASCAWTNNLTLWCWGVRLGSAEREVVTTSQQIALSEITGASVGREHACAIRRGGTVWCWGDGDRGQLGSETGGARLEPIRVPDLTDVIETAPGSGFTCARKQDGSVWCWGNNSFGELGDGTTRQHAKPTQVVDLPKVVEIKAGYHHICARSPQGMVYCWGAGSYGQLGNGLSRDMPRPTQVVSLQQAVELAMGMYHSCARTSQGSVLCWGNGQGGEEERWDPYMRPAAVAALAGSTAITAGVGDVCGRTADGVRCWHYPLDPSQESPKLVHYQVANLAQLSEEDESFCGLTTKAATVCWRKATKDSEVTSRPSLVNIHIPIAAPGTSP